jgi:hypothetical protein
MRLDELTRELEAQADAAMAASPVAMDALLARRSRVRRRRAVSGAAAAVLVAGLGVAWWGGTTPAADSIDPGPTSTGTPSPTSPPTPEPPEVVGGWTAFDCTTPQQASCELPETLTYRGRTYTELGGDSGTQPVHAGNGVNRELGLSVVPTGDPILVLAGATGTGPGSRLLASVNWAESTPLPGTGLSIRLLRVTPDSQKVVVQEVGRPGPDEALQIATYHPVG